MTKRNDTNATNEATTSGQGTLYRNDILVKCPDSTDLRLGSWKSENMIFKVIIGGLGGDSHSETERL